MRCFHAATSSKRAVRWWLDSRWPAPLRASKSRGWRIAIRQMVAEELGCDLDRIEMVEGDTALTPDQGPTAGSSGVMRGGVEIRQAAATAREALLTLAATRLQRPRTELEAVDNAIRPKDGGAGVRFGELVGDRQFNIKADPKAPRIDPATYK